MLSEFCNPACKLHATAAVGLGTVMMLLVCSGCLVWEDIAERPETDGDTQASAPRIVSVQPANGNPVFIDRTNPQAPPVEFRIIEMQTVDGIPLPVENVRWFFDYYRNRTYVGQGEVFVLSPIFLEQGSGPHLLQVIASDRGFSDDPASETPYRDLPDGAQIDSAVWSLIFTEQ